MKDKNLERDYDFIARDPETNLMAEVKIVRLCKPDKGYEMPMHPDLIEELAVSRFKDRLIKYLHRY